MLTFKVTLKDDAQFKKDALRLCWLRQDNASFLVLTNTTGTRPTLKVLKFEEPARPPAGQKVRGSASRSRLINRPLSTMRCRRTGPKRTRFNISSLSIRRPFEESYTVYIQAAPFPGHPVTLNDPTRYGQIGVCAVADQVDGGVSIPATIMAIYQDQPAPPASAFTLPHYRDLATLKATPADVHGKSTFAVRWRKSGNGVQHFVYRAMDTTLFLVDNARRSRRRLGRLHSFRHPQVQPGRCGCDQADQATSRMPMTHWLSTPTLTASQLFILANLAENNAAYTRLHSQPIYEDDTDYQDRNTEIPDPISGAIYTPDSNLLVVLRCHARWPGDQPLFLQSQDDWF